MRDAKFLGLCLDLLPYCSAAQICLLDLRPAGGFIARFTK